MSIHSVYDIDIIPRLQKLGYYISQPSDLLAYIADDIELSSALVQAPDVIARFFGTTSLRLYILTDKDDTTYSQLVIKIGSSLEPRERVNRLNALIDNWLIDLSNSVSSKLTISIEKAE